MSNRFFLFITYLVLLLISSELAAQESRSFSWLHPKPQGQSIRNIYTLDSEKWYGVTLAGDFIRTTDAGNSWKITENITGINGSSGNSRSLNDLHMFDEKTGIVCGEGGILARTTNGGSTWTSFYHPDRSETWYDIFFIDNKTGFVSGQAGNGIRMTTDGGLIWNRISTPSVDALSFYAINEAMFYFTSTNGIVYISENGGATWSESYTGSNDTLWKINFIGKHTTVVCGTSNAVKVSTDRGVTWHSFNQNLPQNTWYDIDFQFDKSALPITESFGDEVFPPKRWTNLKFSGVSMWERSTISPYLSPACVWSNYDATGGDNVLMSPEMEILQDDKLVFYMRRSYTGTIFNWDSLQVYAVPSGGNTSREWIPLAMLGLNIRDTLNSNYPPRNGTYKKFEYLLGKLTGNKVKIIFRHKNKDGTGVRLDEILVGSHRSTPVTKVYLTGNQSNVYRNVIYPLVHYKQPWMPVPFINSSQIYKGPMLSTSVIGEDSLIISGINGNINRSFPYNANIAYSDRTTGNNLYDIWADVTGDKIISIGSSGNVLVSSDAGNSWDYNRIAENSLNSLSMISDNEGWIAGSEGFLYKTTDGGVSWDKNISHRAINLLYGDFYEVNFVDGNTGWAFDSHSNIIKTTNGGKKWLPQNIILPDDVSITNSYFENYNTGFFVGTKGTIYKTTNGGVNWFSINFSDKNFNSIEMVNSLTGWVCGEKGTLIKTTNSGKIWEQVTLPYPNTDLKRVKFLDENNGMVVGSSGKTYRTSDGGATWTFENSGATDHYSIHIISNNSAYISSATGNIVKFNEKSVRTKPQINSENIIPSEISLFQNYPNPFNPTTQIKFAIPTQSIVTLKVYDSSGREMTTLINSETMSAGTHSATYTALNLSSGIYFYNLIINGSSFSTRKMLLIK